MPAGPTTSLSSAIRPVDATVDLLSPVGSSTDLIGRPSVRAPLRTPYQRPLVRSPAVMNAHRLLPCAKTVDKQGS